MLSAAQVGSGECSSNGRQKEVSQPIVCILAGRVSPLLRSVAESVAVAGGERQPVGTLRGSTAAACCLPCLISRYLRPRRGKEDSRQVCLVFLPRRGGRGDVNPPPLKNPAYRLGKSCFNY